MTSRIVLLEIEKNPSPTILSMKILAVIELPYTLIISWTILDHMKIMKNVIRKMCESSESAEESQLTEIKEADVKLQKITHSSSL